MLKKLRAQSGVALGTCLIVMASVAGGLVWFEKYAPWANPNPTPADELTIADDGESLKWGTDSVTGFKYRR